MILALVGTSAVATAAATKTMEDSMADKQKTDSAGFEDDELSSSPPDNEGENDDETAEEDSSTSTPSGQDVTKGETPNGADESNRTSDKVARGALASGIAGKGVESARRAGTDRWAEAAKMEHKFAKNAAEGGWSIAEDGSSVFTPDNGIDKVLTRGGEEKLIQVKHYGRALSEGDLGALNPDIDVIASSNGTAEGVNPADFGLEEITYDDLSLLQKAELEWSRIERGARIGVNELQGRIEALVLRATDIAGQAVSRVKSFAARLVWGAKSALGYVSSVGKSAVTWFLGLSLGKQILITGTILSAIYLVWRWRMSRREESHRKPVAMV